MFLKIYKVNIAILKQRILIDILQNREIYNFDIL